MARTEQVPVGDGQHVEVRTSGDGEPLVLIQTALIPEELVPLGEEAGIADRFRVIDCRRRGYSGSSAATGPGSISRDARDCLAVLEALDATPAHVVGASFSGAVALELAASAPQAVATLTLLEPPPVHGAPRAEFLATNRRLHATARERGVTAALEEFTQVLGTRSWVEERAETEPDTVARIERDAETFFVSDIPALLTWQLEPARAAAVTHPILSIGGAESHPWFAHVRAWLREQFPQTEDHLVPGAGHAVARTHSAEVAALLGPFLARHPIS